MQDIDFENKRIYERVPIKLSLRLFDLSSNRHSLAQTQDISAQGIGVLADKELQPLSHLEMWLPILNKGESLYARGKIVWSRAIKSNKYSAGVKLEEVDSIGIRQLIWGYLMKI